MTREELYEEAETFVDAIIDTLKQDIRGTLYNKLNQEDVKDALVSVYYDSALPREKRIAELEKEREIIKNGIHY